MKVLFATVALAFCTSAHAWTINESIDAMTDKVRRTVSETSTDGSTFTLLRKSDNSIWAYLKLAGGNQFMVNENLMVRIDKNIPVEYHDRLQKLTARHGAPILTWEWNPSLIGFQIGSCGQVFELLEGSTMIIRYHPNHSTTSDVHFDISKGKSLLEKVLQLDASKCKR